ncbi:hypothetical protein DMN91_000442 [Ooceraea biroi]|uniref:Uncharacterized protein n=1 Tax=Ooceraea biroi TaxID=2015173 RepID=A0A3L8E2P1_OOCBI|nr:hypothetical protein DMN91_000442 [Ooceraea biroi]
MRVYVLCVYWMLLLVSVVSSGFLFLLVALESVHAEEPSFHLEKNETYEVYSNITLNYDNHESFESSVILNTDTQAAVTFKTTQNDRYRQEEATAVSGSFEAINDVQEKKDADVLAESLMQQPNLSQGHDTFDPHVNVIETEGGSARVCVITRFVKRQSIGRTVTSAVNTEESL